MSLLRRVIHQLPVSIDHLFPSVSPRDQAVVYAAMEGRTPSPVSMQQGEGSVETGPATTAPTFHGAGGLSGDGTAASERRPVPAQTTTHPTPGGGTRPEGTGFEAPSPSSGDGCGPRPPVTLLTWGDPS